MSTIFRTVNKVAPLDHLLITCEHGGNRIPARYRPLFANCGATLDSHRGYDAGALPLARELAAALGAELIASTVSRLLVDLNRSPGTRNPYSEFTRTLDLEAREVIADRHYRPYRQKVEGRIASAARAGMRTIHVSCHSFTPVLNGRPRNADVGLLFDPRRAAEKHLCTLLQQRLGNGACPLAVRRNYPYRGVSDGLISFLRQRYDETSYVGIELEINQQHVTGEARGWSRLRNVIVGGCCEAIREFSPHFSVSRSRTNA